MQSKGRLNGMVGAVLLGGAAVLWAWPDGGDGGHERSTTRTVVTAAVEEDGVRGSLRLAGVTRAVRRATLGFELPGRLVQRSASLGSQVRRGDVLARLDRREVDLTVEAAAARLAEVEARLAQAQRDATRVERLAAAKAATREELEGTNAALETLEALRAAAAAQHDDAVRLRDAATLVAPFAGTVTAAMAEPGEWIAPGRPVVELTGEGAVEIEVELPESVAAAVQSGSAVEVSFPYLGRRVDGRLTSVGRAAGGPGRLFPAVVALPVSAAVPPGVAAEVLLDLPAATTLTVPVSAVLNPGASRPYVFVVRDGAARQVDVELGALVGEQVAVTGALGVGDEVVVGGVTRLADGDPVEVRR